MATKSETWIIYKTKTGNAPGWKERMLMPSQGLTDILSEEWNWSGHIPKVGDRLREYENLQDPGNGVTHGRDGDWVVSEIRQFTSPDTEDRIVVCYCEYQPIPENWEELHRGAPVDEMLAAAKV
ncbi:MAG: hypothetical protein F6K19_37575 [Cyanothece sp. SIO1E1]|nr:hypothetical protein [Cyanothece sp. SIO1E1]